MKESNRGAKGNASKGLEIGGLAGMRGAICKGMTNEASDIIYSDDGNTLTYFSKASPSLSRSISRGPVVEAAFLARDWHGGQWSGLYALQCGSFDFVTICRAAREFSACARQVRAMVSYRGQDDDVDALEEAHRALVGAMHPDFEEA